jgi:hypothetical protein
MNVMSGIIFTISSPRWCKGSPPAFIFLFTSRLERHIRDTVNSFNIPTVDLTCTEMTLDIETFVTEQLDTETRFARISASGKELAKDSLISHAGGMYVIPSYLLPSLHHLIFAFCQVSLGSTSTQCHFKMSLYFSSTSYSFLSASHSRRDIHSDSGEYRGRGSAALLSGTPVRLFWISSYAGRRSRNDMVGSGQ